MYFKLEMCCLSCVGLSYDIPWQACNNTYIRVQHHAFTRWYPCLIYDSLREEPSFCTLQVISSLRIIFKSLCHCVTNLVSLGKQIFLYWRIYYPKMTYLRFVGGITQKTRAALPSNHQQWKQCQALTWYFSVKALSMLSNHTGHRYHTTTAFQVYHTKYHTEMPHPSGW